MPSGQRWCEGMNMVPSSRQGGPLDGQTCNRFGPEKKNSIHKATEAIKTWAFVVTVNPTTIVK